MKRFLLPVALAAALSAGASPIVGAAPARQNLAHGSLGNGAVTLWQQGAMLGVTIDKAALSSLPAKDARVDLVPAAGMFRLVEIDWNANGHPPAGVYTVPHFDAHFYVIPKSERDAIAFAPPGKVAKPASTIVPMGYVTDGSVAPQMGMHYVSAMQPEFHGKPFTVSQLWGYDKGHLAFIEAMFTRAFVNSKQHWTQAVAKPSAKIIAGLPRTMAVGSNASGGVDVILSR